MHIHKQAKWSGDRGGASCRQEGFSLIELMVAIALVGLLLTLGLPSLSAWLQSNQIRNAAESVQTGLQLAKSEAVRRNTAVQFALTSLVATAAPDWSVSCVNPTATCPGVSQAETEIQGYTAKEGAAAAQVASTQAVIGFSGVGRVTPVPAGTITINFTNRNGGTCAASGGPMRCLRILVTAGGQIRMCDPALPATNLRGC